MENSMNEQQDASGRFYETDLDLIREKLEKKEIIHLISQNKEDVKRLLNTLIDENYELQLTIATVGEDISNNRVTVRMFCTDKH